MTESKGAAASGKPLSILLLSRSLEVGGAERQLVALAKGLVARGHSVTVALFYRTGDLLAELDDSGVELVDLRKSGRWDTAGFFARTIAAVRKAKPDIIYSFLSGPNLVAAAVRPFTGSAKLVWSVRGSNKDLSKYDWLARVSYRVQCRLSRAPELIIANSSAGADYSIANGFPADKFVVIPNGIDTSRFRPDAELRTRERALIGIAENEIAVGMLARLDPMKGHEVFLEAAAIVTARAPDIRFFCIGDGSELGRLERLRDQLGLADRVVFVGRMDPAAGLSALDIACSCSLWGEGFSNSIAEAMACGLPCVVTDVGDSAMIVGDSGAVVPPGAPDALAAAILAEAERLPHHDPAAPRARIVENFSIDAMVERTLAAFHKLTGLDKTGNSSQGKPG